MRYLLLIALLLVPSAAMAQIKTPVSKEKANIYFQSCVSQPPREFTSQQSQQIFCACTAARMTQFYSMNDMEAAMSPDPAIARPAYNKMLTDVYAPCMDTPAYEHYYTTCINNPDVARYKNPQGICTCAAQNVATHLKLNGPAIFTEILKHTPNIVDPEAALYAEPAFQTFAQEKLLQCLK